MPTEPIKASPTDAGCWIDGHWGQYGIARMIEIAAEHGFGTDQDSYVDGPAEDASERMADCAGLVDVAQRHLGDIGQSTEITADEHEWLSDQCDNVEAWLNEHVAPEGYSFAWHDGEFFLWSDESWEETGW